jgi:hypothetical protein
MAMPAHLCFSDKHWVHSGSEHQDRGAVSSPRKKTEPGLGVAHVIECLPSKPKTLSSDPILFPLAKKKKKKNP